MSGHHKLTAKSKKMLARLNRIERLNGGTLTPEKVLLDAIDPNSPLHSQFTWDDSIAAEKYRLAQARVLIRSFRFEIVTRTSCYSVPVFVHAPRDGEKSGYRKTENVAKTKDLARMTMNDEIKRMRAACDRCEGLAVQFQLEDYFLEIRAIVDRMFREMEGATGTDGI